MAAQNLGVPGYIMFLQIARVWAATVVCACQIFVFFGYGIFTETLSFRFYLISVNCESKDCYCAATEEALTWWEVENTGLTESKYVDLRVELELQSKEVPRGGS